jgi:hypothetical protein
MTAWLTALPVVSLDQSCISGAWPDAPLLFNTRFPEGNSDKYTLLFNE